MWRTIITPQEFQAMQDKVKVRGAQRTEATVESTSGGRSQGLDVAMRPEYRQHGKLSPSPLYRSKLEKVRGGVGGGVLNATRPAWRPRHAVTGNSRELVANPTPSPYKSKLEAAWAQSLEMERLAHEIRAWWYEPCNFRLPGKKNYYKIDFIVKHHDNSVTAYSVKGRNKSDDRSLVKWKVASALHTWIDRWIEVKRIRGVWEMKEI